MNNRAGFKNQLSEDHRALLRVVTLCASDEFKGVNSVNVWGLGPTKSNKRLRSAFVGGLTRWKRRMHPKRSCRDCGGSTTLGDRTNLTKGKGQVEANDAE